MKISQNSRRNFLSSLAILSAGTVIAGSPANLFSQGENTMDLQRSWDAFVRANAAKEMIFADNTAHTTFIAAAGHEIKTGKLFFAEKANLLVQPTWIYWQSNADKPADVLVHVYENKAPYKKLVTLNRFELEALVKASGKAGNDDNLLLASTAKNKGGKMPVEIFQTRTNIKRNKHTSLLTFHRNNQLLINEKIIYNA